MTNESTTPFRGSDLINARKGVAMYNEMYEYICNKYDVRLDLQRAIYVWAKGNRALKIQTTK